MFVPVVDSNQQPLMPTIPSRARRWIKNGKATGFWKRGVFCVRLNVEPSGRTTQLVAVGIDPGSKKEGLTVKSAAHTYMNIQADAVTWVSGAIKTRREMRRARRFRKTPYRASRKNRKRGGLPPSTKARWQWKIRLCRWLGLMFPIGMFVVEDIQARTKGQRRWDRVFSPLEVGKRWFYEELGRLGTVELKQGWETKDLRDALGLHKTRRKTSERFDAHCVDSWVLANWAAESHREPDNTRLFCITPLRFHRRQLHYLQPAKGGRRRLYGGTRSLGFKRGSLVHHHRFGITYVGGHSEHRVSLYSISDGQRLTQRANPGDCKFLTYNSWRSRLLPCST